MKKNSLVFVFCFLSLSNFLACAQKASDEMVVIDERDQEKTLLQTIPIDSVWSGHPVGFSLMTDGDRQYVAYYDKNRHMMVGQRNLGDDEFQLHTLPVFDREEGKGTSTILNWDSHNSVTFGIDQEGFIHLAGNMHVHPFLLNFYFCFYLYKLL